MTAATRAVVPGCFYLRSRGGQVIIPGFDFVPVDNQSKYTDDIGSPIPTPSMYSSVVRHRCATNPGEGRGRGRRGTMAPVP